MSWERLSDDPELLFRVRPPDGVLAGLLGRAADLGLAAPSLEVGRLLEILAAEASVRRILEVGRGLGLSTICLARGASAAEVVSVDPVDDHVVETAQFLQQAGVEDRVTLLSEDPLVAVEGQESRFDLIHLSSQLSATLRLTDRVLPKLVVGGLLTVEGVRPSDTDALDPARAVAGYLVMHPQLDAQVLAIGEGLAVARKKRPLVTEMGGPY